MLLAAALTCAPSIAGASDGERAQIVQALGSALKSSGAIARVYYSAECESDSGIPPLPSLRLQTPPAGAQGVEAVRRLFQDDANVVVTEEPKGIVRIAVGDVSRALLDTHVELVTFEGQGGEFETIPHFAIGALFATKEMQAAQLRLGTYAVARGGSWLLGSSDGRPHLPLALRDTTADRVLDTIAQTFSGVVFYGVCQPQPYQRRFDVYFEGFGP
jgi:hypothetical protein